MEIKLKVNLKSLILTIASFIVAYMTAQGSIQTYITFADTLNEIGFFIAAVMLGTLGLFTSFEKSQSK